MLTLNRIVTGLRNRLRHALDYKLVRWYQLAGHQQTWYLRRLFRWQQIDLVIDVGGNAGQYADFIRKRVGYRGLLVTFEPIPWLASELALRAKSDPLWIVVNKALGDSAGQASFNVMNTTPMSSLLSPKVGSQSTVMQYNEVQQQVQVEVQRLDDWLQSDTKTQACRNIYLKLDVQGYELKVLQGSSASLPRIGALQAELSVAPLYEGQPSYLELLHFLDDCGYTLSSIPANDYAHFPEMVDFDCHWVRTDRLASYLSAPTSFKT
jgi:FkbM family methyltransferase